MGAVPGWVAYHDPDYASEEFSLNRAQGVNDVARFPLVFSEFGNGQKCFGEDIAGPGFAINMNVSLNPNAWTAFHVIQPVDGGSGLGPAKLVRWNQAAQEGDITLDIGFNRVNIDPYIVYESPTDPTSGSGETRLTYDGGLADRTIPTLMMTTFSIENGLQIFDNGSLVESATNDKRPLTQGLDGDQSFFRNSRGRFGLAGILNTDLGAPENTGHRKAIERFVMQKYGIPQGA